VNVPALRIVIFMTAPPWRPCPGSSPPRANTRRQQYRWRNLVSTRSPRRHRGTSLFAGAARCRRLLGALVIGSVANGLDLLGQSADVKTIITGLILLAAVRSTCSPAAADQQRRRGA